MSLKELRKILESDADLRALVDAARQLAFFSDNGNDFEKRVALKYLTEVAARAAENLDKRKDD